MGDIVSAISAVGFPVVICLLMWYENTKNQQTLTELVKNNTEVITKLTEKIDRLLSGDK